MTVLRPAPTSADRLSYDPRTNTFTGELSDVGALGRVYDDACDEGITLISHKTGREIVFAVEHEERDREGDLLWLDLRPVNRNEWAAGTVRLFND